MKKISKISSIIILIGLNFSATADTFICSCFRFQCTGVHGTTGTIRCPSNIRIVEQFISVRDRRDINTCFGVASRSTGWRCRNSCGRPCSES